MNHATTPHNTSEVCKYITAVRNCGCIFAAIPCDRNTAIKTHNYSYSPFRDEMEISSRNKAQMNKIPYFSWPSTPCLRQQPRENKNRSTRHLQHTQISSNSSTIAANNSTVTYIIHYSIELIAFSAEYTLFHNCNFNLVYRYSLSVNLTLLQCNGYQMLQLQLFCAPENG